MDGVRVKICGIKTEAELHAVAAAGAAYVGLNFFARSPSSATPTAFITGRP